MAEINIERKKKPAWPWILLLLIILALVAWAIYSLTQDKEIDVEEVPSTGMVLPSESQAPLACGTVA
ncbi:hypothetical protein [Pontibacter mangrovi]|uniref:Uncharacterized protein n=1 Tax=Pontibacter mangrovi TaxID=2589816 RepID=A0A501WKP6_9BACT|nr:hypothetical protein [Pontibacter mangrovi]TPE46216.1 hypothetical protein FJM65_02420 [Pontibacter mangrovi]